MPNVSGQIYAYMALTAILPDRHDDLRATIDALPEGPGESPFSRVPQVHFARWVIIPQLVYQGPPQKPDPLQNQYLLFAADVDAPLEGFFDAIRAGMGEEADAVWGHCVGYPGVADRDRFHLYMRHNQIDSTLPVLPYGHATVGRVRGALELRRRLIAFAVRAQGLDAAELHDAYLAEFASAGRTPERQLS